MHTILEKLQKLPDWTQGAGLGAGLGILGGGGASLVSSLNSPRRPGETPAERRSRIIRTALVGSALGGGAGASLGVLPALFKDSAPPQSHIGEVAHSVPGVLGAAGAGGLGGGLRARAADKARFIEAKKDELMAKFTEAMKNQRNAVGPIWNAAVNDYTTKGRNIETQVEALLGHGRADTQAALTSMKANKGLLPDTVVEKIYRNRLAEERAYEALNTAKSRFFNRGAGLGAAGGAAAMLALPYLGQFAGSYLQGR